MGVNLADSFEPALTSIKAIRVEKGKIAVRRAGIRWLTLLPAANDDNDLLKMKRTKFKSLDVRPILERGEEPFSVIREKVDGLKPLEGLRLIAPFLPSPLIEMLKSEGLSCRFERGKDGSWVIDFWRE